VSTVTPTNESFAQAELMVHYDNRR
jgi:hypothetical protein